MKKTHSRERICWEDLPGQPESPLHLYHLPSHTTTFTLPVCATVHKNNGSKHGRQYAGVTQSEWVSIAVWEHCSLLSSGVDKKPPPPQKKSHALALWQKKNNFSAPSAMLCCVTGNGVAWNETLQLWTLLRVRQEWNVLSFHFCFLHRQHDFRLHYLSNRHPNYLSRHKIARQRNPPKESVV